MQASLALWEAEGPRGQLGLVMIITHEVMGPWKVSMAVGVKMGLTPERLGWEMPGCNWATCRLFYSIQGTVTYRSTLFVLRMLLMPKRLGCAKWHSLQAPRLPDKAWWRDRRDWLYFSFLQSSLTSHSSTLS